MPEQNLKVLIVEDEEDILSETKEILEKKGFKVFTALDSESALGIFQKERPKVCVLDIHMPKSKLDGIGILEEIRKVDKLTYCIMLSRIDEKDKVEEARRLGANRYVLKPIDISDLLDLINEGAKIAGGGING